MTSKIEHSIGLIRDTAAKAIRPAAMISFGKDSMVMAALIREALLSFHGLNNGHFPSAHSFPIAVIYHRDPWFSAKHEFAERTARAWGMEVHDYTPMAAGVKAKEDSLELVARYALGTAYIDVPKNTLPPEAHSRRDYICALNDWVDRPKTAIQSYPWDLIFIGQKSGDVDPFEGQMRLKDERWFMGHVGLVFPLKDWTDQDVWNYIDDHHIEYDERRYATKAGNHAEFADKWLNNDYVHACTRCIDPRESAAEVMCPKLKRNVPNLSGRVMRLREQAPFIEEEKASGGEEQWLKEIG